MMQSLFLFGFLFGATAAQPPTDFSNWNILAGRTCQYLEREAFTGTAFLKDQEFLNGTIEFDIAFPSDRVRSYAGVNFRMKPGGNGERFYIRPHRSALYGDVLQYVPSFNGVDSWQLYGGFGFAAPGVIPPKQWVHIKIEVADNHAQVFIGNAPKPSLIIPELQQEVTKGRVILTGPEEGAYFSNVKVDTHSTPTIKNLPRLETSPGIIEKWQISQPTRFLEAPEAYPKQKLNWKDARTTASGLLDISRWYPRSGQPDLVYVRTSIDSPKARTMKLDFGYSDTAKIYLNGQPVFSGESSYQSRDSSFLGLVGFNDSVYLPLKKGKNELLIALGEQMGGWGLIARDGEVEYASPAIASMWSSDKTLSIPETCTFDTTANCLYVSNYDAFNPSEDKGMQSISRIGLTDHKVVKDWAKGVKNPTGMVIVGKKLYVVEPQSLAIIDIPTAAIENRVTIEGAVMLNDIAVSEEGSLYITDSGRATIFRLNQGKAEPWVLGSEFLRPNGIRIKGNTLYVGTNGDGCLKTVDLTTKETKVVANLGLGIIDGIRITGKGDLLVSHNDGRLYRVSPTGSVEKLLDLTVRGTRIANFDFWPEKGLIAIPTFTGNQVLLYRLK